MILLSCTLPHSSSIPMGAVNFYMQEHFLHSLIQLLYTFLRWIYLQEGSVHLHVRLLFPWMQSIFTCKNVFNTRDKTFIPILWSIYLQECSVHSLVIFYSHECNFRAWNLFWASVAKPVLWQLMILLPCTLTHISSIPMGAIDFHMKNIFHSLLIWSHQFWPC